jgi:hypothetical protein
MFLRLKHFYALALTLSVISCCISCSGSTDPSVVAQDPTATSPDEVLQIHATPQAVGSRSPRQVPNPSDVQFSSEFNVILGRPTDSTITANVYSKSDLQMTLFYGAVTEADNLQTSPINLKAGIPQNIEITGLSPDTDYFYQVVANGVQYDEHTFHTQRAAGSSFTFTIDSDPHNRDPKFDSDLYLLTLAGVISDQPDFHINLGDTFMTEKAAPRTYAETESTFTDMRPYFVIIGADVPLFLVNGNHEGELGWLFSSTNNQDLPVWSTRLRQLYYPNPVPNGFYSGSSLQDPHLYEVRDGYYAWTWGDALFVILDPYWYTLHKPTADDPDSNWEWTLGREQYDWLKLTLQTSSAKYKFIFLHNLVGGIGKDGRGGIEAAPFFEWGGLNADGTYGFDGYRPGWGLPIHQLLIENHVTAVFHGHDHVFVRQELDGIVYQEVPQPDVTGCTTHMADEYGYVNGDVLCSSGYLRVSVSPDGVIVDYIRVFLDQPMDNAFRYTMR